MVRKAIILLASCLYLCFSVSCSFLETPSLKITNDGTELKCKKGMHFQEIMSEYESIKQIPYVHPNKYSKPIELTFDDRPPESIRIYSDILNEDGTIQFENENLTEEIPKDLIDFNDNTVSFSFPASWPAFSSKLPEPGEAIRGFRIICTWNALSYTYSFVVRTDAFAYQSAAVSISSCNERELFHSYNIKGNNEFYLREQTSLKISDFVPDSSLSQTLPYGGTVDFTFPEDGLPDSVELINDVLPLDGAAYEYQGDTRTIPWSELTMKDGKLSFTVKPEYFAEGEQNCNVTYLLCTWDGLTSVYTVIFRVNP